MKRSQRLTLVMLVLLISLILSGCINRFTGAETELNTGRHITPEEIDSIFDAISASVTEKYPTDTDADGDIIVYWLEGGSVWHSSALCGSIANAESEHIYSGKVTDAIANGKERACKNCSDEIDITVNWDDFTTDQTSVTATMIIDRYPKEYDSEGELIVYWLEDGSVWHESSQCGIILNASPDKVRTGSPYEAFVERKERACKVCSSDSIVVIDDWVITTESVQTETAELVLRYPKEYDSDGELVVYWLESGNVWHESYQCGIVLKLLPDKVIVGNPYDAFIAGKSRACKVCSSDSIVNVDNWVITTETAAEETTEQVYRYPKEYNPNGELIVYWLESGSVWHESFQCATVQNASPDKVNKGSAFEAFAEGKQRACKVCSADSVIVSDNWEITTESVSEVTTEVVDPYPKEYDTNGELVVYWLESGSVWHESPQCGTVLKASLDKINKGAPYEAYCAGKMRACKICSRDSIVIIDVQDIIVETTVEETTAVVEKYPRDYDNDGNLIVYWLESGSVWHESIYCSAFSDVSEERILSGSISDAVLSHKERVCKKCSQK